MREPIRNDDARLDAALDAMRLAPEPSRDDVAVMAARAVLANAPATRASRWTLRAAAAIVTVALGSLILPRREAATGPAAPPRVAAAAMPTTLVPVATSALRPIVFELEAPDARSVQVLGDFNDWSRSAGGMQRGTDGRWRLTTLLPPGRYVYAFLVDGRRFERDPARDTVEDRDFGVTGSELVVSEAP